VNDGLRPALERLTEIQSQLQAWKQHAIDEMLASAKARGRHKFGDSQPERH
jgi:hypothetical protein